LDGFGDGARPGNHRDGDVGELHFARHRGRDGGRFARRPGELLGVDGDGGRADATQTLLFQRPLRRGGAGGDGVARGARDGGGPGRLGRGMLDRPARDRDAPAHHEQRDDHQQSRSHDRELRGGGASLGRTDVAAHDQSGIVNRSTGPLAVCDTSCPDQPGNRLSECPETVMLTSVSSPAESTVTALRMSSAPARNAKSLASPMPASREPPSPVATRTPSSAAASATLRAWYHSAASITPNVMSSTTGKITTSSSVAAPRSTPRVRRRAAAGGWTRGRVPMGLLDLRLFAVDDADDDADEGHRGDEDGRGDHDVLERR